VWDSLKKQTLYKETSQGNFFYRRRNNESRLKSDRTSKQENWINVNLCSNRIGVRNTAV